MIINSKYYNIPVSESTLAELATVKLITFSNTLTSDEEVLLDKMLHATGLTPAQRKHFDMHDGYFPLKRLVSNQQNLRVIAFDCEPSQLGLQLIAKRYQLIHLHAAELVFVDDLNSIGEEKPLKKYMWNLFKKWFLNA